MMYADPNTPTHRARMRLPQSTLRRLATRHPEVPQSAWSDPDTQAYYLKLEAQTPKGVLAKLRLWATVAMYGTLALYLLLMLAPPTVQIPQTIAAALTVAILASTAHFVFRRK